MSESSRGEMTENATTRRSGRPTQRDTIRKSERLIGVATDFFVEHGFSGTTIEAIAQAANMGKQAVYTRFSDKEALFNAVIRRLKEKPVFERPALNDEQPLAEGLPERVRAIFTDAAKPESMKVSKLAMREGHRFPDLVHLMVEGTLERYTRPFAAYIANRKAAGEARDIDPGETAGLIIDLIFAELTRSVYTDTPLAKAQIDAAVTRIARLVIGGIGK